MPQKTWAVGEEVLAADFNTYVQDQVLPTFGNTATRDSQWTAPPNGAKCVTTDTYTTWLRKAGAWVTDPARVGVGLSTGSQSIGAGTAADIAWSAESFDTDGFHAPSATTVVIPSGLDGMYLLTANATAASNVSATSIVTIDISSGAIVAANFIPAGQSTAAVAFSINATAGMVMKVRVHNGHSGALFYAARFLVTRVSP